MHADKFSDDHHSHQTSFYKLELSIFYFTLNCSQTWAAVCSLKR